MARRTGEGKRRRGRPPKSLGLAPPRERLLDAAHDLFYSRGVERTGVNEIAARAGVSKVSLYQEFGSKDDLVRAYVADRDRRWFQWFETQMAHAPHDPRRRLLAAFDVLARFTADPAYQGCAFINAAAETHETRAAGFEEAADHKRILLRWLADAARAAGADDPDRLALALALLIDGALVRSMMNPELPAADSARSAAETLVQEACGT